jgi:hypothetical protein
MRRKNFVGNIKPLFTQSHLPASAHPLPPCARWGPIWSASTYMSHSYQGLIYCVPVKIAATAFVTSSLRFGRLVQQCDAILVQHWV